MNIIKKCVGKIDASLIEIDNCLLHIDDCQRWDKTPDVKVFYDVINSEVNKIRECCNDINKAILDVQVEI